MEKKPIRSTWKEFEALVEQLHRKFHRDATIKPNDFIYGNISEKMRQIDVSIRQRFGPNELLFIVECKRRSRKVDLEDMEAFVGKKDDIGAHLGIMVSERGFTNGASKLASRKGIKVYRLRDTRKEGWGDDISFKFAIEVAYFTVNAVWLLDAQNNPVELPAGEKAHFFDVKRPDVEQTLDDLVRTLWKNDGEPEGKFRYGVKAETRQGEPKQFTVGIDYEVRVQRYAREASMELLGLTDSSETTHTEAYKMFTTPGKKAVFYKQPEFWQQLDAVYMMLIKTSHVQYVPYPTEASVRNKQMLTMLPELHLEISASSESRLMEFNFSKGRSRSS